MTKKSNTIVRAERVDVKPERAAAGEEQDIFVSVNGINCIVPKGKRSSVPDFIAEELKRRERAIEKADDSKRAELAKAGGVYGL